MAVAVESLQERETISYREPDRSETEVFTRFPEVFGDVIRLAAKERGISAKRALRGQGLFLVEYDDSNIVAKVQLAIDKDLFTPKLGGRALQELQTRNRYEQSVGLPRPLVDRLRMTQNQLSRHTFATPEDFASGSSVWFNMRLDFVNNVAQDTRLQEDEQYYRDIMPDLRSRYATQIAEGMRTIASQI